MDDKMARDLYELKVPLLMNSSLVELCYVLISGLNTFCFVQVFLYASSVVTRNHVDHFLV